MTLCAAGPQEKHRGIKQSDIPCFPARKPVVCVHSGLALHGTLLAASSRERAETLVIQESRTGRFVAPNGPGRVWGQPLDWPGTKRCNAKGVRIKYVRATMTELLGDIFPGFAT